MSNIISLSEIDYFINDEDRKSMLKNSDETLIDKLLTYAENRVIGSLSCRYTRESLLSCEDDLLKDIIMSFFRYRMFRMARAGNELEMVVYDYEDAKEILKQIQEGELSLDGIETRIDINRLNAEFADSYFNKSLNKSDYLIPKDNVNE